MNCLTPFRCSSCSPSDCGTCCGATQGAALGYVLEAFQAKQYS